jgi:hypothetical protein
MPSPLAEKGASEASVTRFCWSVNVPRSAGVPLSHTTAQSLKCGTVAETVSSAASCVIDSARCQKPEASCVAIARLVMLVPAGYVPRPLKVMVTGWLSGAAASSRNARPTPPGARLVIGVAEKIVGPVTAPDGTSTTTPPLPADNVPPALPIVVLAGGPEGMPTAVAVGISGGGAVLAPEAAGPNLHDEARTASATAATLRHADCPDTHMCDSCGGATTPTWCLSLNGSAPWMLPVLRRPPSFSGKRQSH